MIPPNNQDGAPRSISDLRSWDFFGRITDNVEEKFTKFSGEPRDAREKLCNMTYF